ncbi:hypothetical protein E2C01_056287 [Portunus trituberculatus]|uniref:Uncharacterized protein n=1 Tax=Portunus trituberculatus TaxID=210409 RepID=A0A5B7H041_PORTR|nr:hypothetical protein [Portunus trituberculatus]
MATPGGDLS